MLGTAALAMAMAATGPSSCPALRWVTLGTAGGPVPTAERSEPANLLIAGDRRILVDVGDGTADQLARAGLDLGTIDTVFLSHLHLDHSGGLGAVIGLRWMNEFPGALTVYGPPGTKEMVDGILASLSPAARIGFGLGKAPPPPAGSVRVVELAGGRLPMPGPLAVRAVENSHFDTGNGTRQGISLSYRFTLGGRSITYTGDTGPSAAVQHLARDSDLLVSEVIALDRLMASIRARRTDAPPAMLADMARHLATHHLTPAQVGSMAQGAGVRHVVLTHYALPGPLADAEEALRSGVRAHFAGPLDLARDLSSFDVGCEGSQ